MLPLLGQAGFSEWNPMASFSDVFFMGPCSLASWSKQVQLLQTHVGTCDIRQIATSHMLLKVCERHFDHFEKLKLVRSGFLYFHARTGHEVIGAPRRIPTVPARSRQLHFTAIARLLQSLPRGCRSRIFAGIDPSARQLQQDRLWSWAELLHQEHGLACGQRQNTDTARLLLDLELGLCTVGKHKRLAGNAEVTGENVRLSPFLPWLDFQEHPLIFAQIISFTRNFLPASSQAIGQHFLTLVAQLVGVTKQATKMC